METPLLFQRDISGSPTHRPLVFWRWILSDHSFPTRPRSSRSDHPLLRTSFAILPLLIPLCTRKSASYLSQFCIVFHHLALISHLLFALFLAASFVSARDVVLSIRTIMISPLSLLAVSSGHISQIFIISLHPGVILDCHSSVYHLIDMSWPFSVRFPCYPTIFHYSHPSVLDFCLPHLSALSPITFTHWEPGGWF